MAQITYTHIKAANVGAAPPDTAVTFGSWLVNQIQQVTGSARETLPANDIFNFALTLEGGSPGAHRSLKWAALDGVADLEILLLVDVPAGAPVRDAFAMLREQGGGSNRNLYRAGLNTSDGRVITRYVDGSSRELKASGFYGITGPAWIRARAEQSSLSVKVWAFGVPEPATWDDQVADPTFPTAVNNGFTSWQPGVTRIFYLAAGTEGDSPVVPAGGEPPPASVRFAWQGAVTSSGFSIVSELSSAENAELTVATSSDLSDPVHVDIKGYDGLAPVRFDVTGLNPAQQYFWRVATENGEKLGSVRTFPLGAANLTIALGSCSRGLSAPGSTPYTSNAPTFDRIRERDPDLFIHMGDFHYRDISGNSEELFAQAFRDVIANQRQADLYSSVPLAYMWDDHDYGANNSGASSASRPAAQSAYRKFVPHYPLLSSSGNIFQDFVIGRFRVVLLDVRSHRSGSTILGPSQLDRLWAVLDEVADQGQALIINSSVPWVSSSDTDTWRGASAQRAQISEAIASRGLTQRTLFIAGDAHMLAIDDGTNNTYANAWAAGGPPVFQAAPLDHQSSTKGGPYSEGVVTATRQQYGVIEINDDGGAEIGYTLRGFSLNETTGVETEVISLSGAFQLPVEPGFSVSLLDNTNAPVNGINVDWHLATTWDGSAIEGVGGTLTVNGGSLAATDLPVPPGTYWLRYRVSGDDEVLSATVEVS